MFYYKNVATASSLMAAIQHLNMEIIDNQGKCFTLKNVTSKIQRRGINFPWQHRLHTLRNRQLVPRSKLCLLGMVNDSYPLPHRSSTWKWSCFGSQWGVALLHDSIMTENTKAGCCAIIAITAEPSVGFKRSDWSRLVR